MLRKNLFAAHIAYNNSINHNNANNDYGRGALTALTTLLGKKRSNADMLELFLWIIVMAIVGYITTNHVTFILHYNSQLNNKITRQSTSSIKSLHESDSEVQSSMQLILVISENQGEDGNDTNATMRVLADSDNNPRFVVPRNLRASSMSTKLNSSVNNTNDDSMEQSTSSFERKSLKLLCSAPYPVQFKYTGLGYPSFTISVQKRVTSEYNTLAMYIITLSFDLVHELDTGRYTCEPVGANYEGWLRYIDLYVPGEMKLLHASLRNRDGLHDGQADYYDISSGLRRINRTTEVIALHHQVVDGKDKEIVVVVVPCGISHPMNKVSLFIKDSTGFESQLNEGMGGPISYDFARGFELPVYIIKNMMKRFRGPNFICRSHHRDGVRELAFKIYLTDASNSQVTPATRTVLVSSQKLSMQKFQCKSDEPIMIKWLDGPPASVQHKTMALANGTTTYEASFIATPSQFPSGEDTMARFQCVRSQDQIIIHTWKWIRNGVTKPFLTTYNGKEKKLSCCMNASTTSITTTTAAASATAPGSGSSSLHAPQLLVKTCSTMVECQVKASFQPKITSAGGTKYEHANKSHATNKNETCIGWTVPNDFHAGLIMCSGGNGKTSLEKEENDREGKDDDDDDEPSSVKMLPVPVVIKWNDDLIILNNKGLDANISVLKRLTSIRLLEGSKNLPNASGTTTSRFLQIECIASTMLFAKGFRWTMHMKNGKIINDIQRETTWEGEQGIIRYNEYYEQRQHRIRGVLQIRRKEYQKPFLSIDDGNSPRRKGQEFAKLRMVDNIGIVKCEVPLWNDIDIWIPNFTDVRFS